MLILVSPGNIPQLYRTTIIDKYAPIHAYFFMKSIHASMKGNIDVVQESCGRLHGEPCFLFLHHQFMSRFYI